MIKIDVGDKAVSQALDRLFKSTQKPRPALEQIGEILVDSTKRRFSNSIGPDGQRWAPNTQTTILRYLGVYKGSFNKRGGRLSKKGAERAGSKRPLIGETGSLSSQISYEIDGAGTLFIGSTMIYAATQQFGAKKRQFQGKAPWGDIPARPFLGLSDQDRNNILDTISDYLTDSLRP